ncbi:DNA gyrase subunit B [Striga asiatica]|uniref:DNA gyrase subunit B n=1 Tax=Striga asiatica TaxID=4170 RepID=A0A5A7QSZ7_STRAF|nr:DNA gyrase subunit B [Striga asiatica]
MGEISKTGWSKMTKIALLCHLRVQDSLFPRQIHVQSKQNDPTVLLALWSNPHKQDDTYKKLTPQANNLMERDMATEKHSHRHSIWKEISRSGFVLKTAVVIIGTHILQLGVIFERVHDALSLNGVSTLNVIMIRQEQFLSSMELSPSSSSLLWSIVPSHPNFHTVTVISLDFLDTRHIRG